MTVISERPDVSIIVIAHDVRDEVLACFESIEQHAGPLAVECCLVDNGSSDGTAAAVAERFPDVDIIRRERNEGVPARNHGLRRARGRHRMFLDSDASLTPGALPVLVRALDEDPSIGLLGPKLVYPDGRLQLSTRRFPPALLPILRRPPFGRFFEDRSTVRRYVMADDAHDRRREVEYVLGACQIFRDEAQAAAGEIDDRIWYGHDDADWCLKIREAGWRVVYEPRAEVVHDYRRMTASKPLSGAALRQLLAHVHFQRKWRSRRRRLSAEGRAMDAAAAVSKPPVQVPVA